MSIRPNIPDNQKTPEHGYLGNPHVKRDGVNIPYTQEQLTEYIKCMHDPAYFAKAYLKVIHLDRGLVDFDLYPYQERMFDHFNSNRFSIVLACRQSGKSISSVAYLLWYVLFKPDQTIAVLANKGDTSREMLARITLMLENIPFWLQPGTKTLNKGSIEFSNHSRIVARATSGSSIRGMSVNLLYLDEFAFVENDVQFYTSTYPVVSSGKTTRIIITSTANGLGNVFHKIWEGAVQGTNEFKPFRVDWWDVPGRDENWKKQTIANTSELQFMQEFGNDFLGTGSTLISGNTLLGLRADQPIYTQNSMKVYERPIEDHNYMIFVDVAKGRGMDYSSFTIIDITTRPFKQVATYRDNRISPLLLPDVIWKYAKAFNQAYVFIESNDQGAMVANGLYYELEYENVFVESQIKANSIGINMNKKVKRIGCSQIKDLIEEGKLTVIDSDTIIELSTFEARGTSYEARDGCHDDTVMTLVLLGYVTTLPFFSELTDTNVRQMIYADNIRMIEDEIVPFGVINDGRNNEVEVIDGDVWYTYDSDKSMFDLSGSKNRN